MPKKPLDYKRSVVYKITCNDPSIKEKYIGSTTDFCNRKSQHKYQCKTEKGTNYSIPVYVFIRAHGGWNNWRMTLIERYPCAGSLELKARERHYYDTLGGELNYAVPGQIREDYYKQYYATNREKLITDMKKPNICYCGGRYTTVNKQQHLKTKAHREYIIDPPIEPIPEPVA